MISWRRVGVIVGHEVRVLRRDPFPFLVLVVFPLAVVAFLKPAFKPLLVAAGHPGANGAEQVVPGQAVVDGFFIVSITALAFFSEFGGATWDRLRASRASSLEIILGKSAPRVAMSVAQFVVVILVGMAVFGLRVQGPLYALAPLVVAFAVCLVALGVAVTALCHTVQQANAAATVGLVVFGALGGALVPFNVLPGWAKTIAPLTPTYWAMRGFRSVILDGQALGGVVAPVVVLLGMSALFAVVALSRFRFEDTKVSWA
ncbi:MAG TPA: ABC transporter permease [Acidimicrobiia bacterium]|nr:ABC transporter permease [Acidimicrobiia bacterium]